MEYIPDHCFFRVNMHVEPDKGCDVMQHITEIRNFVKE